MVTSGIVHITHHLGETIGDSYSLNIEIIIISSTAKKIQGEPLQALKTEVDARSIGKKIPGFSEDGLFFPLLSRLSWELFVFANYG